jgi:DNA polymerase-3 subunit beta
VLRSIIGKDVENVEISFDNTTAQFSFGGTTMICRLVVGKYPKYRDVIPTANSNILQIDRQLLLNTVKRVAVCANKASNHIKFTLKEGQLEVSAQDLGFALAAYEKVSCNYQGDELSIGFKSTFLTEILANMGCNGLVIKFADARRAALILPAEEEAATEKVCGILMPIMIQ